ncbi:MAG: hypothetical protein RDV48_24225 [Candidatus Eremiobacteraeota bacterium]|nr:hypothetical protein [Candidatus Eremiobacteraeota bacterium]
MMDEREEEAKRPHDDPPGEVSDRSLQLRIAGVLQSLIGMASAALAFLILFSGSILKGSSQTAMSGMIAASVVYAVIAFFFMITGVEAIRLRRWVRPVMLSVMWPALFAGISALVFFIFMMPAMKGTMTGTAATGSAFIMGMSCVLVMLVLIFIVIPLSLLWLYHGGHVRRYLESIDPLPSWADAAPIPVFGLALWTLLIALQPLAVLLIMKNFNVFFFGRALGGYWLSVYALGYLSVGSLLAYGLYRMKPWAWWLALVLSVVSCVSVVFNVLYPPSARSLLSSSGMPPGQAEASMAMMQSLRMPTVIFAILWAVLLVGYVLFIRRYFTGRNAGPQETPPPQEAPPPSQSGDQ